MLIKHIFLIVVLSIPLADVAFSQGEYLQKGQSGIGISAGYTSNKDATGFGGEAGYSIGSIFDIDMSISRGSFAQLMDGDKLSVSAFTPGVTLHVRPDSNNIPIFESISMAYETDSYSANYYGAPSTGHAFSFGTSISANIYEDTPDYYFQPLVGVAYVIGSVEGESTTAQAQTTEFLFGASLVYKISPTYILAIQPAVEVDKNQTTFSVSAGFVLETHH